MSMRCFLAVDKPLQKTRYPYRMILLGISDNDMLYNDQISFSDKLAEQEEQVLGNIFKGFYVYAIHSGFQLNYEPRYKRQLSESAAKNALDELRWLKRFAKKRLKSGNVFMIVNLWLGKETVFDHIKTEYIDVNGWELSEDKCFEFACNTIYNFTDNSIRN